MKNFNPDSYCGIYCGACSVFMHGQTGHSDGFVTCLYGVPKAEIACGGCKSDSVYAGCRLCNFRDCAVKKGITHCVDCAEYPCRMYKQWQSAAKFLPHVSEAASSLTVISRDGTDSWLIGQKKRWSCPGCGAPFSWYLPVCLMCGRNLAAETYKMAGWRNLFCRFLLPVLYRKGKGKGKEG